MSERYHMSSMALVANALQQTIQQSRLELMYGESKNLDSKHKTMWMEFGYQETLSFYMYYTAYERTAAGFAAVTSTLDETWQDFPIITDGDKVKNSGPSLEVNKLFSRLWNKLKDLDRRQMIGRYAGLILQFNDSTDWSQPVNTGTLLGQGIVGLKNIIPAWEQQLKPLNVDQDQKSETYGEVLSWQFMESAVDDIENPRNLTIHKDRILILAEGADDQFRSGIPLLRAGFNNIINLMKVSGAAPESYFKNSARQLLYNMGEGADLDELTDSLQKQYGDDATLKEMLNDVAAKLNQGFDAAAFIANGQISTLQSEVPDPKSTWEINAQEFSGSTRVPMRKLFGSEQGKLAADQDDKSFAKRNMGRRNWLSGFINHQLIDRLIRFNVLKPAQYEVEWSDLLEPSFTDKLDMMDKMITVNEKATNSGQRPPFTEDEMRAVVGFEPLTAQQKGLPVINRPPANKEASAGGDE